jgi:hypothetical protein
VKLKNEVSRSDTFAYIPLTVWEKWSDVKGCHGGGFERFFRHTTVTRSALSVERGIELRVWRLVNVVLSMEGYSQYSLRLNGHIRIWNLADPD